MSEARLSGSALGVGRCAICLALFSLLSCSGLPRDGGADGKLSPLASYATLKMEQLRALAESEPAACLEAFASLSGRALDESGFAGPSKAELDEVAATAVAKLRELRDRARESRDWAGALTFCESFTALGADPRTAVFLEPGEAERCEEAIPESLLRQAQDMFDRGLSAPALALYARALGRGRAELADTAELELWSARALALRDRASIRRFATVYAARGLAQPSSFAALLESRDSVMTMRKGVVTVRVDRGIRIEQGRGVPDRSLGSGFCIDPAGYVLTNYHVISSEVDPKYEGYSRLSVRLSENSEERIPAKVVGWDRLLDLALIKIESRPEYVFSLSENADLVPGEKILVIGSPVGLENTLTSGIVSAVGRRLLQTGDIVQIDAALNPGNSGGPLIDESGEAAGIVFAGLPQYQNLNFAIPSAWALRVLPELFRGGEVIHPWLGLALAEGREGLDVLYRHPASAEGLELGDRLLSLNGFPLAKIVPAQALVLTLPSGSLAGLCVAGPGGERRILRLVRPRPFEPIHSALAMDRKERLFPPLFGMELKAAAGGVFESQSYSIARIWPGSIADESGLSVNDPIALRRFFVDDRRKAVFILIHVKKRKAGFLESLIQLPAPLEVSDFL